MKKRRVQFLLKLAAVLVLTTSLGLAFAIVQRDYQLPVEESPFKPTKVKSGKEFPSQRQLVSAFSGRFFSEAPKKAALAQVKPVKRSVSWPSISLSSVMVGQRAKIAVLKSGPKTYTLQEGEKFTGVEVVSIKPYEIELSFRGESKKFRTSRKTHSLDSIFDIVPQPSPAQREDVDL